MPSCVLAVRAPVEVRGRNEPGPREKMLVDIEQADQVEKAGALGDGIDRIVGEGDDAPLAVGVSCALHLQPQGSITSDLGDHDVSVVHVRLDAGRNEATVRTNQYLGLDHQLDNGSERRALKHVDRLLDVHADATRDQSCPNGWFIAPEPTIRARIALNAAT